MSASVSNVLERRTREAANGAFRRALMVAAGLHLALAGGVWIAGRLEQRPSRPVEYVAVQIVPAARLGVTTPRPAPPRPEPKPESPKPAPPEPAAKAPVLPDPKAKKPVEARKPSEPRAQPPQSAASAVPAAATPEVQGSPTGSPAGLALGAAVAGFDNPNFTYGYYVDQMLSLISTNWVRPPVGSGVETTVYFRIQRDGRVTEVRISHSSGINSFDLAALRAVQASSPLPPLPRGFRDGSLGVNLIVR